MAATISEAPLIDGTPKPYKLRPDILNQRQHVLIREYLKHGNATKAGIAAGYKPTCARQQASNTLALPKVKREVERLAKLRDSYYAVSAEKVLKQAARMAFADPRLYVDDQGALIPLQDLSDEAAAALQGLEVDQSQNGKLRHRYKLTDKTAALDKLMRHLGMFEKDNTQAVDAVGQLLASIHTAGSRISLK